MAQLKVGGVMPQFNYDTPFEKNLSIAETAAQKEKTAILFLRYYGCPVCQYDMHMIAESYDEIVGENGRIMIVLQSSAENLNNQIEKDTFPFDIICDPNQDLYKQFEIAPAESMMKMVDVKSIAKISKAKAKGIKHGEYEGEELQLPAAFIVNKNLEILYSRYGKSVADVPSNEELKELLK